MNIRVNEKFVLLYCIIYAIGIKTAQGVVCFNCTSTHRTWTQCGLQTSNIIFNSNMSRNVVNCSKEGAVCFVRSWKARAKHAWIVQRGCYEKNKEDDLSDGFSVPVGSMSCKRQRLADAEYKMCLCQGDRCNDGHFRSNNSDHLPLVLLNLIIYFYAYL